MSWVREPHAEPLPGYRLIRPLGTGGFGEVWLCEAPGGIQKAIKFVYGNLNATDGPDVRAEQELEALQKVKEVRHPFVLTIERIDIIDGELAIVMELADMSLYDRLVQEQDAGRCGIARDEVLRNLSDAADGLDWLIEHHNLLHLDIKPRNLFTIAGRVKVADFGLVKSLERNGGAGLMGGMSPMYAAPETFSGRISKQSDQYSLAIVYAELLTGQRPFNGRNIRQLAMQHMSEEPDLRLLAEAERPIIARALSKEPTRRYPNCTEFVRALGEIKTDVKQIVVPTSMKQTRAEFEFTNQSSGRPKLTDLGLDPVIGGETMGSTMAQRELGTLRPTLLIGFGGFGRRALREIKHRLLDRLGDLGQVPMIRFLYVDSDADDADKAITGPPDHALNVDQVFPMPLQPVANYRRKMLDHLGEWLPREKLFSLPRSLKTQGSRALGRLAFHDNYLKFVTRVRREVQIATHPESLTQSITQTGLNIRDVNPQVYLFASAFGGSSGCLIDSAFSMRRLLNQLLYKDSPITGMFFCGAPLDPAAPPSELANLYATLTELNHFSDPAITFSSQYGGPDGPRLQDRGPAFNSSYLLQLQHRTPDGLQDCVTTLANYISQELTTPLGMDLTIDREESAAGEFAPFRSFGTYSIWYPRGLLLRAAARRVCQRMVETWQQLPCTEVHEVERSIHQILQRTSIEPEALIARLERETVLENLSLPVALNRMLSTLESEVAGAGNRTGLGDWAQRSFEHVRDWVGNRNAGDQSAAMFRGSKLNKAVTNQINDLAQSIGKELTETALKMLDRPGRRIVTAETALDYLIETISKCLKPSIEQLSDFSRKSQTSRADVQAALDACMMGPGFSLFGTRSTRLVRHFFEQLIKFSRSRLNEEVADGVVQLQRRLQATLEERLRDLTFCRQRLAHLQQILGSPNDPFALGMSMHSEFMPRPSVNGSTHGFKRIGMASSVQILLPFGNGDIMQAATEFVAKLDQKQWTKADDVVQALVLAPAGGLFSVCQKTSDLMQQLAAPLIDQTAAYLGELLPITDVAQAQMGRLQNGKLSKELIFSIQSTEPMLVGSKSNQQIYVMVPSSEHGTKLSKLLREQMPDAKIITVPGQSTDLTVIREQSRIRYQDLMEILHPCRDAYQNAITNPQVSPHSRFDVQEWVPLEV
jgi:eukaryotic-like serine/threonine-protein kinase